jgi:hypothetical protein
MMHRLCTRLLHLDLWHGERFWEIRQRFLLHHELTCIPFVGSNVKALTLCAGKVIAIDDGSQVGCGVVVQPSFDTRVHDDSDNVYGVNLWTMGAGLH